MEEVGLRRGGWSIYEDLSGSLSSQQNKSVPLERGVTFCRSYFFVTPVSTSLFEDPMDPPTRFPGPQFRECTPFDTEKKTYTYKEEGREGGEGKG